MIIGGHKWGWAIYIGRDWQRDAGLMIGLAIGARVDAPEYESTWRSKLEWSSSALPGLIYRQYRRRGWRITLPIGYHLRGRYRIVWGFEMMRAGKDYGTRIMKPARQRPLPRVVKKPAASSKPIGKSK